MNLGESLCISTFFLFPDSRLNLLHGFDFLFWSILNGVTLKTSNINQYCALHNDAGRSSVIQHWFHSAKEETTQTYLPANDYQQTLTTMHNFLMTSPYQTLQPVNVQSAAAAFKTTRIWKFTLHAHTRQPDLTAVINLDSVPAKLTSRRRCTSCRHYGKFAHIIKSANTGETGETNTPRYYQAKILPAEQLMRFT